MWNMLRRQRAQLRRVSYVRSLLGLRRNARLFLVAEILNGLGLSVFMLFFNLYVLSLGESKEFLGLLQSLPSAVVLIVGIPGGMLGDRIGRRRAMLIGQSIGVLGLAAFLLSPNRSLMIVCTVAQGFGNMLVWLNVAPFLTQVSSEEERPFLFSADWSLITLASFVGSLIAGGLPAALARQMSVGAESAQAYRSAMFLGLSLNGLALIPIGMMREVRWPGPRTATRAGLRDIVKLKAPIVKLMLPNMIIGFGAALLLPYMNLFFKERFPIDDRALGTIFAPRDLITAVATMAAPALALRLGKIRSVVFSEFASLGFLLMMGFVPILPIAAAAFWLRGALMTMGHPLYSAFMMEQSPSEERGTVNSIVEMAWQVGWMVGPAISGAVQTRAGFAPLFLATTVFYTLGAGLTYLFFHDVERKPVESGLPALVETGIME